MFYIIPEATVNLLSVSRIVDIGYSVIFDKEGRHIRDEDGAIMEVLDLSHLIVFGCPPMAHIPKALRQKWDAKSRKLISVSYCDNTKGYRRIDPKAHKITARREVVFLKPTDTTEIKISAKNNPKPTSNQLKGNVTEAVTELSQNQPLENNITNKTSSELEEEVSSEIETQTIERRYSLRKREQVEFPDFIMYKAVNPNQKDEIVPASSFEGLRTAFGDSVLSLSSVSYRFRKFKRRRNSLNDEPQPGRPAEAVREENIGAVDRIVREGQNATHREIQQEVGIGSTALNTISHQHLKKPLYLVFKAEIESRENTMATDKMLEMFPLITPIEIPTPENEQLKHYPKIWQNSLLYAEGLKNARRRLRDSRSNQTGM
ncbi:hypothetical protein ILUMI_04109 [Ignelater luminosus]|uniref:Retroviral polymerase SH3-like domain-containing protein n=1 Tax=Ignelater luminosus TaxID=2038154 RepID=A0A8K0DFC8_IGNLU|nr:hypothetical protein ILUMI_04109 [Ignelater luminosus]